MWGSAETDAKNSAVMMAKQLQLPFALAVIRLSSVIGYICSEVENSPRDTFEDHGCFCGTSTIAKLYLDLYATYPEAFDGCHESNIDHQTIECAFKESAFKESVAGVKTVPNRTSLQEIPVIRNESRVYENVTCL